MVDSYYWSINNGYTNRLRKGVLGSVVECKLHFNEFVVIGCHRSGFYLYGGMGFDDCGVAMYPLNDGSYEAGLEVAQIIESEALNDQHN